MRTRLSLALTRVVALVSYNVALKEHKADAKAFKE